MQSLTCRTTPVFSAAPVRRPVGLRTGSVVTTAALPLPKGVKQPTRVPEQLPATFGFVDFAERINSRAAMLGFFGIMIVEAILGKGLFEMAGFNVGNGLPFEF